MASYARIAVDANAAREALQAVELGLGKEVNRAIAEGAKPIRAEAEHLAPYDPTHRGWEGHDETWASDDPGHIKDSLSIRSAAYGAALVSTHPGAIVHEFGGTISPAGFPITIERQAFAATAGETKTGVVESRVEQAIEALCRRHGL